MNFPKFSRSAQYTQAINKAFQARHSSQPEAVVAGHVAKAIDLRWGDKGLNAWLFEPDHVDYRAESLRLFPAFEIDKLALAEEMGMLTSLCMQKEPAVNFENCQTYIFDQLLVLHEADTFPDLDATDPDTGEILAADEIKDPSMDKFERDIKRFMIEGNLLHELCKEHRAGRVQGAVDAAILEIGFSNPAPLPGHEPIARTES